jgi:hypothetical protein
MESKEDIKNQIIGIVKNSKNFNIDDINEKLQIIDDRSSLTEIRDSIIIFNNFLNGEDNLKENNERDCFRIYSEIIYPEIGIIPISEFIQDKVENCDWYDFIDEEYIPDEGADTEELFKIGDKLYNVKLHCEAEWCGDWSVRANLAGDISITEIEEITDYEVLQETSYALGDAEDWIFIKIK